jgi:hypothetical protein
MQNANDKNLLWQAEVKHNMLTMLKSAQSRVKGIASAAKDRVIGQELEAVQ